MTSTSPNLTPVPESPQEFVPKTREDLARVCMEPGAVKRKNRTVGFPSHGPYNALWYYFRDVPMLRVIKLRLLYLLAGVMPRFDWKIRVLRLTGLRIGDHVSVSKDVEFDVLYPENIEIEDDVLIGGSALITAHQYSHDNYEIGRTKVCTRAVIGSRAAVYPGVVIGEGAALGPLSAATQDIPPYEFWAGVPARKVADIPRPGA